MFTFMTDFHMPRSSRSRGCSSSASKTKNTVISVGHALDVCLILVYAVNILIVLRRLIMRRKTEFSVD